MTNKALRTALFFANLLASAGVAFAQTALIRPAYQYPQAQTGSGPASVQLADTPLYFTPYIGAGYGYDDNLFMSDAFKRTSNFYVISPGLKFDARSPNTVFQ